MSKLGDFIKKGIGALTGGDFVTNLVANAITSKVLGGDTKDALMLTALQQGLGSSGLNLFGGDQAAGKATDLVPAPSYATMPMGEAGRTVQPVINKALNAAKVAGSIDPVFKQADNTLGYAKFLVDAGLLKPDSKLTNLLNSRVGEALATGLGSELLDRFSQDDPRAGGGSSRPFGGEGDIRINIPNKYAAGGYIDGQYFPRRNGGIMPSEGSGQKDDVPAMLMAGEFVLTKDAVKGLGNGDSNRGIEKAYSMMNQLENKANNYGY
jgi:hypothetical protein